MSAPGSARAEIVNGIRKTPKASKSNAPTEKKEHATTIHVSVASRALTSTDTSGAGGTDPRGIILRFDDRVAPRLEEPEQLVHVVAEPADQPLFELIGHPLDRLAVVAAALG